MKKFELTTNTRVKYGRKLIQIKASVSFETIYGNVNKGDLGGWVEKESSLGDDVWAWPNAEVFANAVIWGGVIWGGEIWGGEIRGGEIWGGVIRGGEIRGGEIWGGEIWGGVISKTSDYMAFCSIGCGGGVLTAYIRDKGIEVTRGCFRGTLAEFEKAVAKKHKTNAHAKEYALAIKLIKLRFAVNVRKLKMKGNAV